MTYIYLKFKMLLRSFLVWGLVLLSLVLGLIAGSVVHTYESRQTTYHIGVVDLDQTVASQALIQALENHPSLAMTLYPNRETLTKALSNKDILQSYVLLEGFEQAIFSGKYRHIVEVVSMIKSPYRPWLNDQVSVSVIREWIISDGYQRMLTVNPSYPRQAFVEAFEAYDTDNELLSFTVVAQDKSVIKSQDQAMPLYVHGVLWTWSGVLLVMSLIWMRLLYLEDRRHIRKRLMLSGVGPWYYHAVYLSLNMLVTCLCCLLFVGGLLLTSGLGYWTVLEMITASVYLSTCLYLTLLMLKKLPLNFNQLVLIYLGIFMCWALISIDAVGVFSVGQFLQYLSPLTLFFNILT